MKIFSYVFWIDFGWFAGEDFKLFEISVFDPDGLTILHIQITRFIFGVGWEPSSLAKFIKDARVECDVEATFGENAQN